ncbi:hypothetical protein ANCDUO_17364 [Ancylostoma duodenale]|uniref:Pex N-terminal domain-containing protein n=1 Tax=Ancylostoma duodenale TaxID=51022 RepID=A0A0C2G0W7_9BILA|nr:hypothetical protein ANCDUO_17364 [Ancylostoma duodenale]
MKRIYRSSGGPPFESTARIRSLIVLVLWPYVRDKLEKWHEIWLDKIRVASVRTTDLRMKLARIFVRLWPTIKALLTFTTTILQLL